VKQDKQRQLEQHLAAAMDLALAHNEAPVQRITVDATATGQYPYRIVPSDEDFIVCGLTGDSGTIPDTVGASPARSGRSGAGAAQ
jgi:hypothetical protein